MKQFRYPEIGFSTSGLYAVTSSLERGLGHMQKSVFTANYTIFRQCLLDARARSGLTQGELAERLGQTQSWVSKVERGERRLDLVELREFCEGIGVPFVEFVAEFDKKAGRK